MKKLLLIVFVLFISCKKENTNEPERETQSPFTIKYGEVLSVKSFDLKVGFRDVITDSRCPTKYACVWAGVAVLNLWIKTSNIDTIRINPLIYGNCWKEDTARQVSIDTIGYHITLMQLDPYPVVFGDTTYSKSDYNALVNIVKK